MTEQQIANEANGQSPPRRDALNDGIGYRRVTRPANDEITAGSPWALAPWPSLEIAKWAADRLDRYAPNRGNKGLLTEAGSDPQAQLQAVVHQAIIPALRDVRDLMQDEGYEVAMDYEGARVVLRSTSFSSATVEYAVEGAIYEAPVFAFADFSKRSGKRLAQIYIQSRGHTRSANLRACSASAVRRDALHELRNQLLY